MKYVTRPATAEDIDWASEIEAEAYGEDAVPVNILLEWYRKNPTGFFTVTSSEDEKVGHLDILPLRPEALQSLLQGKMVERDMTDRALYTPAERDLITNLYVESIIITPSEHASRTSAIYAVLSDFESFVSRMCDPAKLENVYAIAATPKGEKFMRQLGFEEVIAGRERLDHHPFFAARYYDLAVNINEILSRLSGRKSRVAAQGLTRRANRNHRG